MDPVTEETVRCGEPGELYTRGYSVMKGYWNDPEKTKEALNEDGWMKTGDLAVIDADGYCTVVGRLKDVIIRGGENIYPREIEDQLLSHDAVQNAAVIGLPDPVYGEIVCACVILHESSRGIFNPEDIKRYLADHLAHYKVPKHIVLVSEFPMTVTGKIQKYLLQEAVKDTFQS